MRDSGTVSIGPNLAKSTVGTSGSPAPPPPPPRAAILMSATVMRPFSPLPCSVVRSMSSSRARRRAAGPANTPEKSTARVEGRAAAAWRAAGATSRRRRRAAAAGAARRGGGAASAFGAGERRRGAPASASSVSSGVPIDTLSPTLATIAPTTPALGAGTSSVALSDSSVSSGCSAVTASPGLTRISMIGTSLKSPMSGTLTSILATAGSPSRAPVRVVQGSEAPQLRAGLGASGSIS